MTPIALQPDLPSALPLPPRDRSALPLEEPAFDLALARASGQPAPEHRPDEAREAASKFVASALVLPLLSQLRESSMNSDLFGSGFALDAFHQQLDTQIADRVVGAARWPIVDALLGQRLNTPA